MCRGLGMDECVFVVVKVVEKRGEKNEVLTFRGWLYTYVVASVLFMFDRPETDEPFFRRFTPPEHKACWHIPVPVKATL